MPGNGSSAGYGGGGGRSGIPTDGIGAKSDGS